LVGLGESETKCHHAENYVAAVELCTNNNARLCTKEEILNSCTKGSGCSHDSDLVWTSTFAQGNFSERQWVSCGATGRCGSTGGKLVDKSDANEKYVVRCCSDTAQPNWSQRNGCDVFTESDVWGACSGEVTFEDAVEYCSNHGGRLCTVDEARENCLSGTGCSYDSQLIWTSSVGWIE